MAQIALRRRPQSFLVLVTALLTVSYVYVSARLASHPAQALALALPFVLIWIVPTVYWRGRRHAESFGDKVVLQASFVSMGWVSFVLLFTLARDAILLATFWPSALAGVHAFARDAGAVNRHGRFAACARARKRIRVARAAGAGRGDSLSRPARGSRWLPHRAGHRSSRRPQHRVTLRGERGRDDEVDAGGSRRSHRRHGGRLRRASRTSCVFPSGACARWSRLLRARQSRLLFGAAGVERAFPKARFPRASE